MVYFLLGLIAGVGLSIAYVFYVAYRAKNKLEEKVKLLKEKLNRSIPPADEVKSSEDLLQQLLNTREDVRSIRDRLAKAQEITRQQLDLRDQASQPSKNSMHSKWKNGLIGEINALEEEKKSILESILKDGHDPFVMVLDEETGSTKKIPLSEFLGRSSQPKTDEQNQTNDENISPAIINKNKFVVIKGGKDDGGNA
jgi:hypothetical protein